MDAICREADLISLHAPLTQGTRKLIDARRLALMKPTAILVNTARGGLVDLDALHEALADRPHPRRRPRCFRSRAAGPGPSYLRPATTSW
jgi:hypothetical protein